MSIVRAYHFVPEKYALDNLRHRRLKIAKINELNDPFELWSISQSNDQLRVAMTNTRDEMSLRYGVLCFSLSWNNPLLWSHYADRHRGMALGFDVSDDVLKKVSYVAQRPVLKQVNFGVATRLLFTKYRDWQYENEARIFTTLNDQDPTSKLYFADFNEKLVLREVIVGPLSSVSRRDLDEVLQTVPNITLIRSRLAFKSFQVVRDRRDF